MNRACPIDRLKIPTAGLATLSVLVLFIIAIDITPASANDGVVLAIDIHRSPGAPYLETTAESGFETALAQQFEQLGLSGITSRWCEVDACRDTPRYAQLRLQVLLSRPRAGTLKRGISFSLGDSGARSSGTIAGTLLDVSCRLKTAAGRLIAARVAETAVDTARLRQSEYLALKLGEACVSLMAEQNLVKVNTKPSPRVIATADPDVYIEQRDVPIHVSQEAAMASENARSRDTQENSGAQIQHSLKGETSGIGSISKPSDQRSQYVLHNKGDTVYLEFGRRRR